MWLMTLRDLQWRQRRFVFGAAATALVFAVTLLLGGLSSALHNEAGRTVQAVGADAWLVRKGATGPFSALTAMPQDIVIDVAKAPGVTRADPLVMAFATTTAPRQVDVTVIGYSVGGMGPPVPAAGRVPLATGEALADEATGLRLGQQLTVAERELVVVGLTRGMTLRGGVGNLYLPMPDAQAMFFHGEKIISTVVTHGAPADPLALGLRSLDDRETTADLLHLFSNALRAVDLLRLLLWFVAAGVVGTVVYLSTLERVQDFAVLKAIGVGSNSLMVSLAVQAVTISIGAAAIAIVTSFAIAPAFPLTIRLALTGCLTLAAVSVAIGGLASVAGLRRAVAIDPAVAFEGA